MEVIVQLEIASLAFAELKKMLWISIPGAENIHGIKLAVNVLSPTNPEETHIQQPTTKTAQLISDCGK